MNHPWLPRVIAALGLVGLAGTFACFPVTVATFPLQAPSPSPSQAASASPATSPAPSPSP